MGQTAAEIEYELERKRNALSGRISRLERRVRDDISSTRENVTDRASAAVDTVTSKASPAVEKVSNVAGTSAGAGTPVAEHPKGMVGGAALAGFVFGLFTSRKSDRSPQSREPEKFKQEWLAAYDKPGTNGMPSRSNGKSSSAGSDDDGGVVSVVTDVARGFIASQAASLLESTVESMRGGLKSAMESKPESKSQEELPDSDYAYEKNFTPPPPLKPATHSVARDR